MQRSPFGNKTSLEKVMVLLCLILCSFAKYTMLCRTSILTHYLANYVTTEWMCDEHISQILDLLQHVIQEGLSKTIEIESMWFLPMLRRGYKDQEEYMTHTSYQWLHGQGQAFGTGAHE